MNAVPEYRALRAVYLGMEVVALIGTAVFGFWLTSVALLPTVFGSGHAGTWRFAVLGLLGITVASLTFAAIQVRTRRVGLVKLLACVAAMVLFAFTLRDFSFYIYYGLFGLLATVLATLTSLALVVLGRSGGAK